MTTYSNSLKKKLCELICVENRSTIKTADEYNVPLKTLENWITAYNKNRHCFDEEKVTNNFHIIADSSSDNNGIVNYDDMNVQELKDLLMSKDIELERLKKTIK